MINTYLLPIEGFQFSAIHAGLKYKRKDLSLIYCEKGAICAATFTTNQTKAAPVIFSENVIKNNRPIKAVVINSGNANACTGFKGLQDVEKTASLTAELLHLSTEEVLISSTGVIGVPLPIKKIELGLPQLIKNLSPLDLDQVAEGIMTTDTVKKTFSTVQHLASTQKTIHFSGIAKGSGMIHPNMATMLGFVMTDALIDPRVLKELTSEIVAETFNMVTVDGDTSTNDMFLVMASGAAQNPIIDKNSIDYTDFKIALSAMAKSLAVSIAKDGEGASKLLTVKLQGADTIEDARKLAKSVVSSSLVKAAFFGNDANWGRIICALGYADATFNPDTLHLSLSSKTGSIDLMQNGAGILFDEDHALTVLKESEIDIHIKVGSGPYKAQAWGCDLTYEYVKINGAYRT